MEKEAVPYLATFNFLFSGIGALIGWNSVLTALDYFNFSYSRNVVFVFTIPLFISTNIFSFLLYPLARYISLNMRILFGLVFMAIILILLPLVAYFYPNDNGFYFSIVLIFFLGVSNSIMQGSVFAFASMFPHQCISSYFTGTGLAGMMICLLRMLILSIFGSENYDGIVIGTISYFVISGLMLFVSITLHLIFTNSSFCKYYVGKSQCKSNGNEIIPELELMNKRVEIEGENNTNENHDNKQKKDGNNIFKKDRTFVFNVFKKIMPMPLLVFLIYVQTFMMFPGVSLKKELSGMSFSWSCTLLIFTFNVFDTIGKYITGFRALYSKKITIFLVLFRFLFYISYLLIASYKNTPIISDDWFAFLNMAVFSALNGFTTSCCMILAPETCNDDEKETTGFLMTHPLYFGIMIGSFLALPFENL